MADNVSIHAPRARGDIINLIFRGNAKVSIHAPRARGDCNDLRIDHRISRFNSRPSCEGRHEMRSLGDATAVSIHAPRARGDVYPPIDFSRVTFQFTPLVRGATVDLIHGTLGFSFNSRPSCEGRLLAWKQYFSQTLFHLPPLVRGATRQPAANKAAEMFQFTPLVRGATESRAGTRSGQVSIHAPRARGDTNQIKIARENLFQFTPLVRGATLAPDVWILVRRFNSRPSCEGRLPKSDDRYVGVVSIHAPRARGD